VIPSPPAITASWDAELTASPFSAFDDRAGIFLSGNQAYFPPLHLEN